MIHATAVPITPAQVARLRKWLQSEEAELYRRVLASNLAILQAEAGQNLIEAKSEKTQQAEGADESADEALPYVHALAILAEFRSKDNHLINVTLSIDPPIKVPETT